MAATLHLPLTPKSDLTLLYGLAHILLREGWINREFIAAHTSGCDGFQTHVETFAPERVAKETGIDAQALSGDVPQKKRLRFLQDFHSGNLAVLIATDVASRGLHIPEVSHVFNFDLPQDCADYVHRIGRTARAGAEGDAISFACEEYAVALPDIEKFIGRKIPYEPIGADLLPELTWPPRRPQESRGGPGRRGGGDRRGGGGERRGGERRSGGGGRRRGGPRR